MSSRPRSDVLDLTDSPPILRRPRLSFDSDEEAHFAELSAMPLSFSELLLEAAEDHSSSEHVPTAVLPVTPLDAVRPFMGSAGRSGFRLAAKKLFLTYPTCPVPKETALADLRQIFEDRECPIVNLLVASERHADDQPHLHVYAILGERFDSTVPRVFDLSFRGEVYHGNYQSMRSVEGCLKYCMKDGDFVSYPDSWIPATTVTARAVRKSSAYVEVAASVLQDPSEDNMFRLLQERPEFFLRSGNQIAFYRERFVLPFRARRHVFSPSF